MGAGGFLGGRTKLPGGGGSASAYAVGASEAVRAAPRCGETEDQELRRYGPDAILRPRGRRREDSREGAAAASLLDARGFIGGCDGEGASAAGADGAARPTQQPGDLPLLPGYRRRRYRDAVPFAGGSPGHSRPRRQQGGLAHARGDDRF